MAAMATHNNPCGADHMAVLLECLHILACLVGWFGWTVENLCSSKQAASEVEEEEDREENITDYLFWTTPIRSCCT